METAVNATIYFAVDWSDFMRGDLIWIVIVVAIGVLTLIKRGVEMMFGGGRGKAPPAGRRPGQTPAGEPKAPSQPTVFEEMKRYFEMIEGRTKKTERPTDGSAPRAPSSPGPRAPTSAPAGVDLDRAFDLPHGGAWVDAAGSRVDAAGSRVLTTTSALARGLGKSFEALDSNISISHEELSRGSSAALSRRRTLSRVRLPKRRIHLRAAVIWTEILGRPRHDRPF